jgi:hypothetical protein
MWKKKVRTDIWTYVWTIGHNKDVTRDELKSSPVYNRTSTPSLLLRKPIGGEPIYICN